MKKQRPSLSRLSAATLIAFLSAFTVCVAPPAIASDDKATISVQAENDLFGSDADKHFTHGTRFSYVSAEGDVPRAVKEAASYVPVFRFGDRLRASFALGQNIYTPEDLSRRDPIADDRPYAGWLYVSAGLVADREDRLDTLELDLGVVGPSALAGQVQREWHKLIDTTSPEGWDNQLHDEPGVVLFYERKWRSLFAARRYGLGLDITPNVNAALGNVFTHLGVGAMVRMGADLPSDYGPPRIRPSLPGSGFFHPTNGFGWYVFAGIEGRLVARNIFLDGNTFRDSPSVDRRVAVADLQAGIAITLGDVRLAYTHILRTEEFAEQDGPDQFGSVSLSYRF